MENTQISLHSGNKEMERSKDQPETNNHRKRIRGTFIYAFSLLLLATSCQARGIR